MRGPYHLTRSTCSTDTFQHSPATQNGMHKNGILTLKSKKSALEQIKEYMQPFLPWVLAIVLMDSTTLSNQRVSSESLTFPCICNTPPPTLHIVKSKHQRFVVHTANNTFRIIENLYPSETTHSNASM